MGQVIRCSQVRFLGGFFRLVCSQVMNNAEAGDAGRPLASRRLLQTLDARLAIAPDPVIPESFLWAHDLEIGPAAVQLVVIQEDDVLVGRGIQGKRIKVSLNHHWLGGFLRDNPCPGPLPNVYRQCSFSLDVA